MDHATSIFVAAERYASAQGQAESHIANVEAWTQVAREQMEEYHNRAVYAAFNLGLAVGRAAGDA